MNRTILSRTLPALAVAMLLPLSAFAHQGTPATGAKSPAVTQTHSAKQAKARKPATDINTASREELMALSGIGDATADKIIGGRPFKAKSELVKRHILTQAEYSKISSHIVAKQAAGAKADAAKTPETKAPEASSPESK
jgi:DNA uptake protein ComE-like DNA-binding protein